MSQYQVWFWQRAREPITENLPFAPGWAKQDSVLNRCSSGLQSAFSEGFAGLEEANRARGWHTSTGGGEILLPQLPHPLHITSGENLCRALWVCVSRESSLERGMQAAEAVSTISSNQFNQETVGLCGLFLRHLKGELKKAALLPGGLTGVNTPWKAQVKKDENCYI